MFVRTLVSLCVVSACAVDEVDSHGDFVERAAGPVLIQPGSQTNVLNVVGNDWVIYQSGATIFVSRLEPGARPVAISDTPIAPGTTSGPQVLVSGHVALIWPDQPAFLATTPSRLVIWSPETGAHVASTRSVTPTNTGFFASIAVSPDDRTVVFVDNVDATGTRGDLVFAPIDASRKLTIAHDVNVDYTNPTCTPDIVYSSLEATAHPLASYCTGSDTTATLATVDHGYARILATGLIASPRTFGRHDVVTTVLADHSPVQVGLDGKITVLDTNTSSLVFPTQNGKIYSIATTSAGVAFEQIDPRHHDTHSIVALPISRVYAKHSPPGQPYYTDELVSPDFTTLMYPTQSDPSTGLRDVVIADITDRTPTPVRLASESLCGSSFEIFTQDSTHALYYCLDPATGVFSLFAGSLDTAPHRISSGATEFQHFGVAGSTIVYADNSDFAAVPFTFDLKLADVADPDHQTEVVTTASTNFMVTENRRVVVYSRDVASAPAGVYLSRLR